LLEAVSVHHYCLFLLEFLQLTAVAKFACCPAMGFIWLGLADACCTGGVVMTCPCPVLEVALLGTGAACCAAVALVGTCVA
jgi:hypothetical protein